MWTLSLRLKTALPIEETRPLCQKPPSPMTAICAAGIAISFASADNATPLLASGWVKST